MESLEHNYYGGAVPQSYQYMGYSATCGAIPASIKNHALMPGSFDYTYHPAIPRTGLTPIPQISPSPPLQHSRLPNGLFVNAYTMDMDERSGRRCSSEEKDSLSPAQSRRKAQNRAAQRAFRERKERHVRDLEAKLELLTTTTTSLQSHNERLKLLLRRAQVENERLRTKTPSSYPPRPSLQPSRPSQNAPIKIHGTHPLKDLPLAQRSPVSATQNDQNLLGATAAWNVLQTHLRSELSM